MSVVCQLAQAILGLGLLSWVGWLLLTAVRDDHRPGADQPLTITRNAERT